MDDRDDTPLEEDEEVDLAASEAGAIGGPDPQPDADPAQRPLVEAGEGESEGFEQAEDDLRANAEQQGEAAGIPRRDAGADVESDRATAEYGDADDERDADA